MLYFKKEIKNREIKAKMENILVVDDEQAIADLVELYLSNEDCKVFKAGNAAEALSIVKAEKISLAVLDVMLPDTDGFTLLKKIREHYLFPIIMLTAKVEDMDKITGLTLGADDYITKPFNPLELTARVKTQLRRFTKYNAGSAEEKTDELDIRGLHICKSSHKCLKNGSEITLTPREFDILWYLCSKQGTVVPSEELFEAVWGEKYLNSNNTVMAHIARLREKLGEPARKPRYVQTVWGVGYTVE